MGPGEGKAGAKPISKNAARKARRRDVILQIKDIKSCFTPILHLLKLKRDDMVKAVAAAGTFHKWMENGGVADLEKDERECAEKDEDLDENMHVYRAFKDRENQYDFIQAADYSDTWFQEKDSEFNVYYLCQRKWDAEGK